MSDRLEHDELLMQAAGKADLDSFGEIVRRYQTWAWKIAWRFTGNENEAADIVQDAFIRILEAAADYRPTASFKTYFHTVIVRLCLDWSKKKKPTYVDTIPDFPDPRPGMPEQIVEDEAKETVRTALDALPARQRMAVILKYYNNLRYAGIARTMNISEKAVERLLDRARKTLHNSLFHLK